MEKPASPSDDEPHLTLELLGVPRLVRGGVELQVLERRDAALLALLVIEGPLPRAHVASLVWPDSDSKRAGNSLRQRLFRLKRIVGQDLASGDRLLTLADNLAHDMRAAVDEALPEGGGGSDLLGTIDYEDCGELGQWVQNAREQWRAARRQALAELASRLETEGRIARALEIAERLVLDDPSAEHGHRRVMRLHYLRGDRSAALAAFERCSSLLQRDLKVVPGIETRQLAAMIEASAAMQSASRVVPLPPALRRPPVLVGRAAVWAQFEQGAQRLGAMLLEGEPGSGKSRLLHDFVSHKGWPPPAGARPGDEAVPYALAARWLDGLLSFFSTPIEPALARELARLLPRLADTRDLPQGLLEPARLLQAVEAVLKTWCAEAGRTVGAGRVGLALDDLQFADSASLDLLLGLATPSDAWVWLFAFRAGAEPAALQRWRGKADDDTFVHTRLAPLDDAGIATLLDSLQLPGMDAAVWAAPLAGYCGGHPFALIDTLADLFVQGQHDFSGRPNLPAHSAQRQGAVLRRLEQLPAEARQLAQVAAAAGQDFSVELAAAVLGCAPVALAAPWRTLEDAGLFRSAGFAHDLVRQAALSGLPQAIELALHRQIAVWLARPAEATDSAPHSARVAAHWDAAQEWALAAQSHEAAAQEARVRSARHEELHALEAAARCHLAGKRPGSDDAGFDCEWRAVHLLLHTESADVALQRAQALLQRAGTERQRAAALEVRAHVLSERYESEAALVDALAAGELAAVAEAPRLQVLAAQRAAAALMRLGRPAEAVQALQAHQQNQAQLEDEERLLWLSDHATALDYADQRIEAVAKFDLAIAQAELLGHWTAANEAWGNKAIALMYLNRMHPSMEASRQAIECGKRAGNERGNLLIDEMSLAGSLRDLGRFADYLAVAQPLPQALRDVGYAVWAFNAENDLAIAYAWLGRPEMAQQTLTSVPDTLPSVWRAARLFTQARLLRWRQLGPGEAGPAGLIRQAHQLMLGAGSGRSYVRLKVALELARDDDAATALASVKVIEEEALQREQLMLAAHALVFRCELMLRLGLLDEAAAAAHTLMARCDREGMPPGLYAPEVWWVAYKCLIASDAVGAQLALQRAGNWIRHTALPQLPALFQRSFLERNPVNAGVCAALARSTSVTAQV